mgnify:CR=1 FL=1
MPRILSPAMIYSKNQLESSSPWTMLFRLDIDGGPAPFLLANYPTDILFHGETFTRFSVGIDALDDVSGAELSTLRITIANIDQQVVSLLENYWAAVVDPRWLVTIWQIDAVQPDETPFDVGEVFSVMQVQTDLLTSIFEIQAEGVTLTNIAPKRRYTTTGGFPRIPRRIQSSL